MGEPCPSRPPSTRASRADHRRGASVRPRVAVRTRWRPERRPAPRWAGRWQTGWTGWRLRRRAPTCPSDGERRSTRVSHGNPAIDGQQRPRPRFRWSGSYQPGEGLVGRGGVEPPTFRFSGGRSYRLSYLPVLALAVLTGLEPATSALTGRRALQLLHRTWSGRPG